MMTCAATIRTTTASGAAHGGHSASMPHPATSGPSALCAPVASTEHGPKHDGSQSIIEKRAARLRHANQIQRARFIRIHQTLSKREGRA